MQVAHVEIVALVAPTLVKDLLELRLGIDVGAQGDVEAAGAGLRCLRTIGVDEEEVRRCRGWP